MSRHPDQRKICTLTKKITPNNQEKMFQNGEFIVSKTDLKGRITYVNRTFMQISGFNEELSLKQPHNIIRHPDMPRGVYYLMWKTLQDNREFFGFVKNLCLDGSYYWAFANITPDYDIHNNVIGYYSVRRPTPEAAKTAVSSIYSEMLALENRSPKGTAPQKSANYLLEYLEKQHTTYEQFVLNFIEATRK